MSNKRMELYNFNFDFVKSDNFKSLFLEYHIENSDKLQKTILSESSCTFFALEISMSKSFAFLMLPKYKTLNLSLSKSSSKKLLAFAFSLNSAQTKPNSFSALKQ